MPNASDALRYGLPGFVLAFAALPLYLLTPALYAEQLGMSLAAVGLVLMLTRLTDAFADPVIGRLMDKSQTGLWAWMASGLLLMAASLALLVNPPVLWLGAMDGGGIPALIWLGTTALAVSIGNSVATLAHQSWAVAWTNHSAAQTRLVAAREALALCGVIIAAVIAAQRSGQAMAVVVVVSGVLAIGVTRGLRGFGADRRRDRAHHTPIAWREILARPEFSRLLLAFGVNALANAVPATLVLFFLADLLGATSDQSSGLLAGYFAAAAVSVAFWSWVSQRLGAMAAWRIAMLIAVAAFVWTLNLAPGDIGPFTVICIATGFALGAELVCPPVLLGRLIDEGGHRGRLESSYFGIWNLMIKLALALAAGLVLPVLTGLDYTPGIRDSNANNLVALQWAYAGIPCALKCIAIVALGRVRAEPPLPRSPS
jgi:glycoside/pentoside/hexuronide:cation symporter, GPH family